MLRQFTPEARAALGTTSLLRDLLADGNNAAVTILEDIASVDAVRAELAAVTADRDA